MALQTSSRGACAAFSAKTEPDAKVLAHAQDPRLRGFRVTFTGGLHFAIDVVSQYLRGKRAPGPETTLYFWLNTAYALGQVAFGVLGLLVARYALDLFGRWAVVAICLSAAAGWLAIASIFLEYREPRITISIFGALVLAAALTGCRP